ncbi:MAG TPA: alkaline phosphatase, partial [Fimbriimonadaceae bacterium]|nr:alkaline phosphatase [Fimbriimonadaceae bacterium]
MKFTRRSLLGAGASALATGALATPSRVLKPFGTKKPKNVIFCVSDGMAHQTMAMADQLQLLTSGKRSYWASLLDEKYATSGLQETRSLSSIVTDSAAASAAWGSGRRQWNGQLNMYPDGTELRSLTKIMSAAGVRCGLVTTTTITHATPAGFAVSSFRRDDEQGIAEKYLGAGVDVLMGGGNRFFAADKRKDKRDLYAEFQKAGFKVARSRQQLESLRSGKALGIFSESHLPFSVDWDNDAKLQSEVPTLAEMAKTAIQNLKGSSNGFLLQIEGGKVDHAAHGNDLAGMIYDQIAFEEAVRVAVEFALADDETLVIITADHATGGPSLNGAGNEYFDSTAGLKTISGMKSSYTPVWAAIGNAPTPSSIQGVIESKLGIQLKTEEAQAIIDSMGNKHPFGTSMFYRSPGSTLAMVLGNHSKVTWTSGNHTSEHVLVTAVGPGSEAVAGLTQNTSFFDMILGTKDLKWSNPTMSFEEAKKHM